MSQDPNKKNIYFSSDDSLATDNSFNSSQEEEVFNEKNDYKNSVYHLKEQMQQFFLQNPALHDEIKFEQQFQDEPRKIKTKPEKNIQFSEEQKKDSPGGASGAMSKRAINSAQQGVQRKKTGLLKFIERANTYKQKDKEKSINFQNEDNQVELSKYWGTISKDILKNSQKKGKCPPSLEAVNQRLNIFRAKIDKIDIEQLLRKDIEQEQKQSKNEVKEDLQQKEKKENKEELENEDFQFYSFKKKMQQKLQQQRNQQNTSEQQIDLKQGKKENLNFSMNSENNQPSKKLGVFDRLFDANKGHKDQQKEEKKEEKNIEFSSKVGQILYEMLQKTQGDTLYFKKQALKFIENYNKSAKETLKKGQTFPPIINKFTGEETKNLNILLPDYQLGMYMSKKNLFDNLDEVKPSQNTPEYEFLKTINKIIEGKIINFWKSCQNTQ